MATITLKQRFQALATELRLAIWGILFESEPGFYVLDNQEANDAQPQELGAVVGAQSLRVPRPQWLVTALMLLESERFRRDLHQSANKKLLREFPGAETQSYQTWLTTRELEPDMDTFVITSDPRNGPRFVESPTMARLVRDGGMVEYIKNLAIVVPALSVTQAASVVRRWEREGHSAAKMTRAKLTKLKTISLVFGPESSTVIGRGSAAWRDAHLQDWAHRRIRDGSAMSGEWWAQAYVQMCLANKVEQHFRQTETSTWNDVAKLHAQNLISLFPDSPDMHSLGQALLKDAESCNLGSIVVEAKLLTRN